jgi:hypothetical protein
MTPRGLAIGKPPPPPDRRLSTHTSCQAIFHNLELGCPRKIIVGDSLTSCTVVPKSRKSLVLLSSRICCIITEQCVISSTRKSWYKNIINRIALGRFITSSTGHLETTWATALRGRVLAPATRECSMMIFRGRHKERILLDSDVVMWRSTTSGILMSTAGVRLMGDMQLYWHIFLSRM